MDDGSLRLGLRRWDHAVPLAIGEVRSNGLRVAVSRYDSTPQLADEPALDAVELSFSQYVRSRARGDDRIVGLPVFVMRGFRHRCIITTAGSDLDEPAALRGTRIGLTGWPDSGNVWTRALLRRDGVPAEEVDWLVGRLTADHPVQDRIGDAVPSVPVRKDPHDRSLVELLLGGELDAVMTPFMPPGFHEKGSGLRPLLRDVRAAEAAYYRDVGFIPGIHLVGIRQEVVRQAPWLPQALMSALDTSFRQWWSARVKLADVSPWFIDEVDRTVKEFGRDWSPVGVAANARMVRGFCEELVAQGLLDVVPAADDLFSRELELAS